MDRITEVTRECFDALIELRRADPGSIPPPAALHQSLRRFVDGLYTRAAQAGFARDEANDIAYAVVALADEIVLSRSDALREVWPGQSLQFHYFHENVAGEGFFTRLETLRRDPRRREVLRVYYLALLLGFQGRYQVRGGDLELMTLLESLQRDLERGTRFEAEELSPHGERPEEGGSERRRAHLVPAIGFGAVALVLLLYLGFRVSLGLSVDSVIARIEAANIH
ncbi:MAG TPA: DotU family type IV/VI secretion system protein [Anaeromyxobacteraceae bacterium]|nr:DotU family type IV/VI secretion system protein [Anaeromyxobacteraceae bacterium]